MLVLKHVNNQKNLEDMLTNFDVLIDTHALICPYCFSKHSIKWGFYERGIIYYHNNNIISKVINIQRIKCKSCNHTNALLPFGIIPYKQVTDEIIINVFLEENLLFYTGTISTWKTQFFKYHKQYLSFFIKNDESFFRNLIINKNLILSKYIEKYNKCFMQIRNVPINICFIDKIPTEE